MKRAQSQAPGPERDALFAAARARFPGTAEGVYLNVAARGLLSRDVRAELERYLDQRMLGGGDKPAMFAQVERVRERFAQLVGADADEIALSKNVSEGLNALAAALPWQAGDNVVLCPELEHPNNVYLWRNLERRLGVEVRTVAGRDGHIPVDRLLAAVDGRTRVVTASSVTFAPGFRTELEPLGRACRERGIFLLVDAAQSVGILHTDLSRAPVDGLAVSTQKGLLGLYGMGFVYCRRAWAERLTPAYLSRFGVDLGDSHEAALGGTDYRLMPAARRFDLGNYNFAAAAAAEVSLGLLLELGSEAIEAHSVGLAHQLAAGMAELGLPVAGGPPGPHAPYLANIVSVGAMGGGHDATDDPAMQALYEHLTAEGVTLSIRRGVLRFSFHLYNNATDVERVLALAGAWRRSQPGARTA
jgi:cysteine desulfurase/selenocysteine lyase